MPNSLFNFPVELYGNMEKYSDTISKGRCRVFYKGRNRNNTYITEEFAAKLIASAPYAPVKGIYDFENNDYTDHGENRSEGRIYGIIPAEPNFAWEKHIDEDGKEREYAAFDVLYYTALYTEAKEIAEKGQSMELYRKTLKGDWQIIEGKKTYVFTDGCFLGLQALGDDVEPCFEGAAFYTKENDIIALLEKYEKRKDIFQEIEKEGGSNMDLTNFKISDNEKVDMIFNLLNPLFNEENNWTISYWVCEVYDEYAVVRNNIENKFERAFYTKNDETNSLTIDKMEDCWFVDVNEEEKAAIEAVGAKYSYTEIDEKLNSIESLKETISTMSAAVEAATASIEEMTASIATLTEENATLKSDNENFGTKIAELEETNSTLNTEIGELKTSAEVAESNYSALQTSLEEVTTERDALAAYKKSVLDEQKKGIIASYVDSLSSEVIEEYTNSLDNYTLEELDMKLTYEVKKANPTMFSKQANPETTYVPKDFGNTFTINEILSKYEKH